MSGLSLHEFWKIKEKNEPVRLEKKAFARKFLMTLLTGPLDEKPENFMVQQTKLGDRIYYILTCPDNEQSFVPPFYVEKIEETPSSTDSNPPKERVRLGRKTVIYCFDEMNEPIPEEIIDEVLQKLGEESHKDPETQKDVIDKYHDEKILEILKNWTLELS